VKSVSDYYNIMRAVWPVKTYKTEFHFVRLDFGRARSDEVLYDEADELRPPTKANDGDNYKEIEMHPLTLVGNLFCYKSDTIEDNSLTGETVKSKSWTSVDFKTGRPAELLDYADAASLAKALREDPHFKNVKGWPPVDSEQNPLSDDDAVAAFKADISMKDPLDFAIESYDEDTQILTVQINLTPQPATNLKGPLIITVHVHPTMVLQKHLEQLTPQNGFFLNEAPEI
jgi:hypothetical protein